MDRTRLMMAVSTGFLLLTFLRFSNLITHQFRWPIDLMLSLFVVLLTFIILEKANFVWKSSLFTIVFYLMNVLFVGLHIGNYDLSGLQLVQLLFLPAILVPQITLTIALSYVRLKNGLLWAIGLHVLNNLLPAFLMFSRHV